MSLDVNTSGNINLQTTVREIEERLHRVEKKVFATADGSGTGRYDGSGTGRYVDNWTQESDGTQYPPSSYGTGAMNLAPGDSVRVIEADGQVNPNVRKVKQLVPDGVLVDDDITYPRDKVVRVIPPAEPLAPFVPFTAPDVLIVGSSFRILRADQSVDPVVHVVTAVNGGLLTYESDGETLEVSRDHVVTVKA